MSSRQSTSTVASLYDKDVDTSRMQDSPFELSPASLPLSEDEMGQASLGIRMQEKETIATCLSEHIESGTLWSEVDVERNALKKVEKAQQEAAELEHAGKEPPSLYSAALAEQERLRKSKFNASTAARNGALPIVAKLGQGAAYDGPCFSLPCTPNRTKAPSLTKLFLPTFKTKHSPPVFKLQYAYP
jgi:hypothetical protein